MVHNTFYTSLKIIEKNTPKDLLQTECQEIFKNINQEYKGIQWRWKGFVDVGLLGNNTGLLGGKEFAIKQPNRTQYLLEKDAESTTQFSLHLQ